MMGASPKSISGVAPKTGDWTAVVGLAFSSSAAQLVAEEPNLVDYIEIPFEHLVHQPSILEIRDHIPIILHCASLSIAGNSPPPRRMVDQLAHFITETKTPWLGEHLAYVRADGVWREIAEHQALVGTEDDPTQICDIGLPAVAPTAPFNVGYTVSPQLSDEILERVVKATKRWQAELDIQILLENGPVYFDMPGSTMTQFSFIDELCQQSHDQMLLLDLAHLFITCSNSNMSPTEALKGFPLDRVIEVHLSGTKHQSGLLWDDHAEPISDAIFALLEFVISKSRPRAVTIEYNWDSHFPRRVIEQDVSRVRQILAHARSEILIL
jgi:uncharacterized protein (UPF0276 family)